jgi:hypothetical protein
MAFSWYENDADLLSSFYDCDEYYRVSNVISTGYTSWYFKYSVNVYNETPVYYKQSPHPVYNTCDINPFEVVKAYHTKNFDPTIVEFDPIGGYDLYEFTISVSGMTGTTIIEAGSSNKNIAHNHINQIGETFPYATYMFNDLNPTTRLFLNLNKNNKITSTDYSTLYCFNGTINVDKSQISEITDIFYLLVHTDNTFNLLRHKLPASMLLPIETVGSLSACTNLKLSVPSGTKNIYDMAAAGDMLQMGKGTYVASLFTPTNWTFFTTGETIDETVTTGLSWYKVWATSGRTENIHYQTSERINYDVICDNKYGSIRLAWLNHLGGYDYWSFNMKSRSGMELDKYEYRATPYVRDATNLNLVRDETKRVQTYFDMKGDELWVVNTNWITDTEMSYLKDLFRSPDVWIVDASTAKYYPIQVTDTSIEIKKNYPKELAQLTVSYKINEGYRFQV